MTASRAMKRLRRWITLRYEASAWSRLLFILLASGSSVAFTYLMVDVFKVDGSWAGMVMLAYIIGASFFFTWLATARLDDSDERT